MFIQCLKFRLARNQSILPGKFWLGLCDHRRGWTECAETPAHVVTFNKHLLVSVYPVTQLQYSKYDPNHQSHFADNAMAPVENISWFQALCSCNYLSRAQGLEPAYAIADESFRATSEYDRDYPSTTWNREANGWRLPSEAEWEYFARAQKEFDYPGTNDKNQVGPYNWMGDKFTTIGVGQMLSNPWGLHDLCGNVGQICWDYYYDHTYKERVEENNTVDPVNREKSESSGVIGRGTCSANIWGRGATAVSAHNISEYRGFRIVRTP